jgi:transposase-like protein
MPSSFFTKSQLQDLYSSKRLSTCAIAKICGCNPKTVYYWLNRYSIPTRPRKVIPVSRKQLQCLYESGLSMAQIGRSIGCTAAAVLRKMRDFGIDSRAPWQSNIIHKRFNFSGNLSEKSYLIGFRTGDLNVVRRLNSGSIIVKSNTTRRAQLELMKSLFHKYGPVWISRAKQQKGVYYFSTSLNSTFSFLSPKHKAIPHWILFSSERFFSFFAGYTDAEGTIGVYDNRARFRIGSYDKTILRDIHNKLLSLGIQNSLKLEAPKKVSSSYGQSRNDDFWRIGLADRYAVFACLSRLLPYLRHTKRRRDVLLALTNVVSRM